MAYSLYETIQGLTVTREDMQEAELLAEKLLNAYYPTLDLRDGSALRDIVLRPSATLMALIAKGVQQEKLNSRIDLVTDSTSTQEVDSMMSNFFINRKSGTKAKVVVRVKFSLLLPTDTVTITPSAFFSIDNINRFIPVDTYSLKKNEDLKLYQSLEGQYWFADILCESESEGDQYNISGGQEFLYFSVFDPYFIGAECIALTTKSVATETNTDFVNRAESAISTRNLINNISIPAKLDEQFNYINDIVVSGYTDYEQMRDYREMVSPATNLPIAFHLGGYVDIYTRTALAEKIVQVTTNADGEVIITGVDPIYSISLVENEETEVSQVDIYGNLRSSENLLTAAEVGSFVVEDRNYTVGSNYYETHYGYSSKQNLRIRRTPSPLPPSSNFDVKIKYWENISSIQSYLDDVTARVVCANYIARGFAIVEVYPVIKVLGAAPIGDALSELKTQALTICKKYTDSLKPGESYIHTDLMKLLVDGISAYNLSTDVTISFSLYDGQLGSVVPTSGIVPNGVIAPETVIGIDGHDENGPKKVFRTFVFNISDIGIVGTA